jgi:hypothetical protein
MERRAIVTFCNTVRDSRNESSESRSGPATNWSLELELKRADLRDSTSERRDLRSSTARMKSW